MTLRRLIPLLVATLVAIPRSVLTTNAADTPAAECPPTARAPTPDETQAAMKTARDHGLLWRLRRDGRTSYLYGTMHVGKLEWMYPGPTVLGAIRSSDVVAVELDFMDPQIVERLQAGMLPLSPHPLTEALTHRLQVQMGMACLPEQITTTMSPEMLVATLVVMSGRYQGLDPSYAVDAVLAGLGHALGKSVLSLETPESQLALIQGKTPEETREIVESSLDQLESGKATTMMTRIAQVWADGRLAEMERYDQWCDCMKTEADRAANKRLVDDRNPLMAERIDAVHKEGKQVFAAVGSLHMIGKVGLPKLMAERGYAVERVELKR